MKQTRLGGAMLAAAMLAAAYGSAAQQIELPCYGRVNVLDAVDCTKSDHDFVEFPEGGSRVETILGRSCRVMPVQPGKDASFFKYRLGKGKGLKANGSYVVVLEYPDDLPRTYALHNRATNSRRSFYTGRSTGESVNPKFVDNHNESIALPQSGAWERWICYTSLTDRTPDWRESSTNALDAAGRPRKNKDGKDEMLPVLLSPEDGFDFVVSQYALRNDPVSAGIAVARILLCEIPDERACYAKLNLPPSPLPRRRIFWREEMSDGGPLQGGVEKRHCRDQVDWYRHKCRQMKMLGMTTFMRDLLEFGHVQHWDPNVIRPNWAWSADAESNSLWERSLTMLGAEYPEFDVLPYYEWAGNFGADWQGRKSYGNSKPCETLNGNKSYTHIWWSENNIDVTDPEALQVTKELMDATILRFKDKVAFAGALFRNRPTQWPIGFGEATRRRFAAEANGGKAVSKEELRGDKALYAKYVDWWHARRAKFLADVQAYLASKGLKEALVLLDGETSEPGPGVVGGGMCTDDAAGWTAAFAKTEAKTPKFFTPEEALAGHLYLRSREEPAATWGDWEWQHACPADRPSSFPKAKRTGLAMPVNRLYSVNDPDAFAAYANADGVQTVVRHYSLNELMQMRWRDGKEEPLLGYAMTDMEHAGRASMMIEVMAMANGDPVNLGYFIGSCFARGFPEPVREFNQNFMALPALPSRVVKNACDDPNVVLREIDCTKWGLGRYYALVHTGASASSAVRVKIPGGAREVTMLASGRVRGLEKGELSFKSLRPWQLLALRAK